MRSASSDPLDAVTGTAISIHALHAERVPKCSSIQLLRAAKFQSTRSMRSASTKTSAHAKSPIFQSTRSMRSASHADGKQVVQGWLFQSTRSMRSASSPLFTSPTYLTISIHALHAERVLQHRFPAYAQPYFNPRAPCGARPSVMLPCTDAKEFQSTRSMRSASINWPPGPSRPTDFNPRAPCGARPF